MAFGREIARLFVSVFGDTRDFQQKMGKLKSAPDTMGPGWSSQQISAGRAGGGISGPGGPQAGVGKGVAGKGLGKGIRNFRKATSGMDEIDVTPKEDEKELQDKEKKTV